MGTTERLSGALAGRYRVERELGSGGMAVVYLAHDVKHGRPVAIKVLRPDLAAAMGAERFHREIEIAAQLNHPNVLALHDSGEADGLLYFVMPFIEGESLRERLDREGRLGLADATRIVREIGGALAYAHGRGLVHRDIKPENILFQAGHALVCDFGIARAASEAQDRLTRTGMAVGTVTYMSPEQLSDGEVDAQSDVYALGCLLHEMLAGEPPFTASSPQAALARKLVGEPADLGAARPDVPHTVREVVRRALATERTDRFPTSTEMVDALEFATTEIAVERDARRRRRGRLARAGGAMAGLATLAALGFWIVTLAAAAPIERVAVLARSEGDADRDFFVQGVSEDLTLELAKAGLSVKSPSAVVRYRESEMTLPEVAAELGVDGIIQVGGEQGGGEVRVDLTLVDGVSEDILWAEAFQGPERSILAVYGDMTRAVASQLRVSLDDEVLARLASVREVDPAVFEALQRARFHWQTLTEEGLATALDYYEIALVRSDSTSAEAWNGIAQVSLMRAQQGLVSAEVAQRVAEPALARAAALDPSLPEIQSSIAVRATWAEWDWDKAERAFVTALDQDPLDSATRAYYALLLLYLDRDEEAIHEMETAADNDPVDPLVQGLRAQILNALGRYADAERVLQAALTRNRGAPFLLSTLRSTYHLLGRNDEALDMWRASLSAEGSYAADGDPEALAALEAGFDAGGYPAALRAVAEVYVERSRTEHVTPWRIGTLYARAGSTDQALHYLELAHEARDQNCPYLSVDPIFDALRGEPRFQALIDAMGLPR